jgi:acetyltransferase-like isoleucine patch superfamily enzyme
MIGRARHAGWLLVELALRGLVVPQWRARALGLLGARVGRNVRVHDVRFTNLERGFRNLRIDDDVYVGPGCLFDLKAPIHLAEGSVLSPRVVLLTHVDAGEHHDSPMVRHIPTGEGAVRIGRHAYLGAATVVLHGVVVGDGAAVGACALVTRDVPPETLNVGVPAKPVRSLRP